MSTDRVRIVTDSSCDLPQAVADELGIEIVPLTIRIGGQEFVDRQRPHPGRVLGASAPRSPVAARDRRAGARPVRGGVPHARRRRRHRHRRASSLSGALSATMQCAELAARGVADASRSRSSTASRCTLGLGIIASDCARLAAHRRRSTTRWPPAPATSPQRTKVWGALDTLENLKKGGRIGGARALLASALAIKPIIEVRDGKVEQGGKQRTRSKALAFLVEKLLELRRPVENLAVLHADCTDVDQFVDMLRPHYAGRSSSATSDPSSAATPAAAPSASRSRFRDA